jgi:hypothetical protein
MLQPNSRIEMHKNGIRFYEQDVLYDDYIYSGSCQIELELDYYNNGFGIMLINATSNVLKESNSLILFKINHKSLEIIYKEADLQRNLGTYSSAYAKTCTDNLKIILKKEKNIYIISIGGQVVCKFKSDYDFDSYFLGYYSNSNNTIKNINIASGIPYDWIVNMTNTNGGYIDFHRDGFELFYCKGPAEIAQTEVPLKKGKYYLKYESIKSDLEADAEPNIKPYIMLSNDERLNDDEKNLLKADNSFTVNTDCTITIKFKGSIGYIKNIAITTSKYNSYIRTTPTEQVRQFETSYIKLKMEQIKKFEFDGLISYAPGSNHTKPTDYSVLFYDDTSYGLYDLNIPVNTFCHYKYEMGNLNIYNQAGMQLGYLYIKSSEVFLFQNVNGRITNFVITDFDDQTTNITAENTIKEYVPAVIKSPIVVLDKDNLPLDLSSSYRYYYNNEGKKYYWFTNTEREYFKPNHKITLESAALGLDGTVIVYGIKKYSSWNLDKIYEIEKEGADTLNACADAYDIIFEEDLRYINKATGEIKLYDIEDYKWIVVDYVKDKSYCLNYRYHLNSYEVDIAVMPGEDISMIYDNIGYEINDLRFVNEVRYIDTKQIPTQNGYITIGGGSH